jgi:ribosomal protein L37AE/L43A
MSIRTATMSNSYSPSVRRPGFFRKLIVLMLFVGGITGLIVLVNYYQTSLTPLLMKIFAGLAIGLAAGAGSRTVFYKWPGFVRFIVMLIVLPIGLFILGIFTNWRMGIGPLEPWIKGVIDSDQLIQLGGTLLVAQLALEAWSKPTSRSGDVIPEARHSPGPGEQIQTFSAAQSVYPRSSQLQLQENLTFLPRGNPQLKFAKKAKAQSRTTRRAEKIVVAHPTQQTRSKRKRLFQRKPNLQISRYEDHRCPYCLEEVKRNDSRGIKKCNVCNAVHHADCWEITGSCQVPHLNT